MADSTNFGRASPELLVRLDPDSPLSLQEQIYRAIRQAVLDGVLALGARVPSSRALALDLRVSRTTTQLAYDRLHAEGYLEGRRGSGTFVARELPEEHPSPPPLRFERPKKHPPLSGRGLALLGISPSARRVSGPPRAFRIGVPALDLFPARLWSRLVARRARVSSAAERDYGHVAGARPLCEAIAQHVQAARGTRCTADQVIVTAGAQRGLDLVCHLLLDPNDEVWLEAPAFAGARSALISAGVRIAHVPVDEQGLDVEAGVARAPGARLAYVTPSHQFPLGVQMSIARRHALLRWAASADAWVVEDDYDSEFRYDARPIPCLHGLDPDGRVVYIGTFSKSLCPSLRLGFLIVAPDVRAHVLHAKRVADQHPPILEQLALADFISHGHYERHLRRMRVAYRERLDALRDALERYGDGVLHLRPVRAGLHAVADLDGADANRVADEALARGVETMPLSAYAAPGHESPDALVLGFAAVPPDAIRSGVQTLAKTIEVVRRERHVRSASRSRAGG